MKEESLKDLIEQATYMLLDRSKEEAELIYCIAKMDPEARGAIIIAYERFVKNHEDEDAAS